MTMATNLKMHLKHRCNVMIYVSEPNENEVYQQPTSCLLGLIELQYKIRVLVLEYTVNKTHGWGYYK
jgi:hypothetical protein